MDPIAAAATAAIMPATAILVQPSSFDITFEMARKCIGNLLSLHPHPAHSNIWALEQDLFEKLQSMQSAQSEEWGHRGLAEQLIKYSLKANMAWTDSPNPGPHHTLGLSATDTRDAKAMYVADKADYIFQLNVTQAIIVALNIAVPKQFKHGTNAAGGIMGANPYHNNQDLRAILLALHTLYGKNQFRRKNRLT